MINTYTEKYILPNLGEIYINGFKSSNDSENKFWINFLDLQGDRKFHIVPEQFATIDKARSFMEGFLVGKISGTYLEKKFNNILKPSWTEDFCVKPCPRPKKVQL